jgi:hypothetical protein
MAADATRLIDDLGPLHSASLWRFEHESSIFADLASANYSMQAGKKTCAFTALQRPAAAATAERH